MHALELGLRYRQLDVIIPALYNLSDDQKLIATKYIIEYLRNNNLSIQEEYFIYQLNDNGNIFLKT